VSFWLVHILSFYDAQNAKDYYCSVDVSVDHTQYHFAVLYVLCITLLSIWHYITTLLHQAAKVILARLDQDQTWGDDPKVHVAPYITYVYRVEHL
jgi:hypothetical protein